MLNAAALAQAPESMPRVQGESVAGRTVILPDAAKGHVGVLVFGFTKASKEPSGAWANKIFADFGSQSGFELYQLPVLEDVPRFVRGMVVSGIRKGTKENMRDHMVPILQGQAELKKLVGYEEPNDAYLVILNRSGQVVRQMHGPFNEDAYAQLRGEIQTLLNH